MQIVIDIPEKWFDDMVREEFEDVDELCAVIQHGTPLPKGHGRLIDAKAYEQDIRKHYFDNELVIKCTEIALDNVPTIIEAD